MAVARGNLSMLTRYLWTTHQSPGAALSFRYQTAIRSLTASTAAVSLYSTSSINLNNMAPIPSANGAPFEVAEPKAGGEKSKKMHSQVVIIGSGPAGHTYVHLYELVFNGVC